jgi:hypothetical protein
MDMLTGEQIAGTNLTDWRKLGQGLHARYVVGDALGHHPRVTMGDGYVDVKLVSDDAVYRDDEGTEHVVEWVTRQDVDRATDHRDRRRAGGRRRPGLDCLTEGSALLTGATRRQSNASAPRAQVGCDVASGQGTHTRLRAATPAIGAPSAPAVTRSLDPTGRGRASKAVSFRPQRTNRVPDQ